MLWGQKILKWSYVVCAELKCIKCKLKYQCHSVKGDKIHFVTLIWLIDYFYAFKKLGHLFLQFYLVFKWWGRRNSVILLFVSSAPRIEYCRYRESLYPPKSEANSSMIITVFSATYEIIANIHWVFTIARPHSRHWDFTNLEKSV